MTQLPPGLLVCHGRLIASYSTVRLARAAGTRHLRARCDPPVITVVWRTVDYRTWTAHTRGRPLDHQVVVALTPPTHAVPYPPVPSPATLAGMPRSVRPDFTRHLAAAPWHYTHEFTRVAENLATIVACTSLTDADAATRARLVPSGTSGGWGRYRGRPVEPCPDRPGTHRHIVFVAEVTW